MKTLIRAQKISIGKPNIKNQAWIDCILQSVQLGANSEVISVSGRVEQLHRKGSSIISYAVTFTNPVTGGLKEVSGLDVQLAIAAFSKKWIMGDLLLADNTLSVDSHDNAVLGVL
jgi:hypothetical protein